MNKYDEQARRRGARGRAMNKTNKHIRPQRDDDVDEGQGGYSRHPLGLAARESIWNAASEAADGSRGQVENKTRAHALGGMDIKLKNQNTR